MGTFTVWVGGGEVNDYLIDTLEEAKDLADYYLTRGYDEVQVEQLTEEGSTSCF